MQEANNTYEHRKGVSISLSYKTRELLKHYMQLLELYQRLETVSAGIFDAMESGSRFDAIQSGLKEKMAVVEAVQKTSQKITALKKDIQFTEKEKAEVRKAESALTAAFNRIVEQEDRGQSLLQKQGMKISRR